ncbi:MAG: MBL fold metallo-hydrolase [Candidatus Micrarchaeota archaeon]|nr:MBL fold metallo-hydrolase [Candidatus Micrarchaeota archaeon]
MVEIVFLGTGGGRFNLVKQIRRTGGFRLNGSLSIHVDPGPGALFGCQMFGQDAEKTDVIVVTHNHIDHMNDVNLLIEAMADGWRVKKRGLLVASSSVIEGDEKGDRGVSRFHLERLEKFMMAKPGDRLELEREGRKADFVATKAKHDDESDFGFVISMDGCKVGYTSDTEYFEGLGRQYAGCDVLVANCLKPKEDGIPGHLSSAATVKLASEAKPGLLVLTHLGMSMLKAGPEKEAEAIGKKSGVKTVAARDGMRIDAEKFNISFA